jgi:hypothetical protein
MKCPFPKGERVLVRSSELDEWKIRVSAGWIGDGDFTQGPTLQCYIEGSDNETFGWRYWKDIASHNATKIINEMPDWQKEYAKSFAEAVYK